jgi:hypothetical protein
MAEIACWEITTFSAQYSFNQSIKSIKPDLPLIFESCHFCLLDLVDINGGGKAPKPALKSYYSHISVSQEIFRMVDYRFGIRLNDVPVPFTKT